MIDFIYTIPNYVLFSLLIGISLVVSLISILIVKRFIQVDTRYRENEVIGYISATICIIYAVLFGFVALYTLNNFDMADQSVQHEASFLGDIFHDSKGLPDPIKKEIRGEIKTYIDEVLKNEWPLMVNGRVVTERGEEIIDRMKTNLYKYTPLNPLETFAQQQVLTEIKSLYEAREKRIFMSHSALDTNFVFIILLGAFLTIGINYFFGMEFYLHVISVVVVSIAVSSLVFLILAIDRPFRGEFAVSPDAFKTILSLISKDS